MIRSGQNSLAMARVMANDPPGNVRTPVQPARQKRIWFFSAHAWIVPQSQSRLPATRNPRQTFGEWLLEPLGEVISSPLSGMDGGYRALL